MVVRELPLDKAHGPDGFAGRFYRFAWSIIKVDIIHPFDVLPSMDCQSLHLLNDAFLTMFPKKPDPLSLGDYRPISLIHSFGKIFSKALANCFAPVLPLLVLPNQSAFIKGHQIQDNFCCVLGMTKALASKRNPQVLLKIDLAKAFGSVGWVLLLGLLTTIGSPRTWTNWISALLYTARTKVLLNGMPGRMICHGRGLRQGTPSPSCFLFWLWSVSTC